MVLGKLLLSTGNVPRWWSIRALGLQLADAGPGMPLEFARGKHASGPLAIANRYPLMLRYGIS